MKIVFLFGAGASKGSEVNGIPAPPLGTELFTQLQSKYSKNWGQLNADSFVDDFEPAMSHLIQSQPDSIDQLQRDMAQFFFGFQPSKASLYQSLIREIFPYIKTVGFVTLNYDLLLERCLLKAGLQPVCAKQAISDSGEVEICLPHGCSHLWIDGFCGPPGSIRFHPSIDAINGPVRAYGSLIEFQEQIRNNPLPPVMSCFDTTKTTPTAKKFIQGQRERTKELIAAADLVVIVGVRVRKHDNHLWEPLSQAAGKLLYCAGKGGAEEFEEWRESHRCHNNDIVLPGYFDYHFKDIVCAVKEAAVPNFSVHQ